MSTPTLDDMESKIRESFSGRQPEEPAKDVESETTTTDEPAPAAEEGTEPTQADTGEPKNDKTKRLLAGKYNSPEELEKGFSEYREFSDRKINELNDRVHEMYSELKELRSGATAKEKAGLDETKNQLTFIDEFEKDPEQAVKNFTEKLIESKLSGVMPEFTRIVSERENMKAIDKVIEEVPGFEEYLPQVSSFVRSKKDVFNAMAGSVGAEGALKMVYLMASGVKGKEDIAKMKTDIEKQIRDEYTKKEKDGKTAFMEHGSGSVSSQPKKGKTLEEQEEELRRRYF